MRNFNVDERRRWSTVSAFTDGLDLVLKKVGEVGCTASGFGLTATITAEDGVDSPPQISIGFVLEAIVDFQ